MFKAMIAAVTLAVGIVLVGAVSATAEPSQTHVAAQAQDCPGDMHWVPPLCV